MPWQGRVAETISEKILYFILISFTFLLSDVACHILIFSFRHYFAMHFLFRQSSLLHGGAGDLPFLKLIHEVNSTSFLQTVNNTIQQYFILGGFHNSSLFRYLCFVFCQAHCKGGGGGSTPSAVTVSKCENVDPFFQ